MDLFRCTICKLKSPYEITSYKIRRFHHRGNCGNRFAGIHVDPGAFRTCRWRNGSLPGGIPQLDLPSQFARPRRSCGVLQVTVLEAVHKRYFLLLRERTSNERVAERDLC